MLLSLVDLTKSAKSSEEGLAGATCFFLLTSISFSYLKLNRPMSSLSSGESSSGGEGSIGVGFGTSIFFGD